jgi:hypothetical protein
MRVSPVEMFASDDKSSEEKFMVDYEHSKIMIKEEV